MIISWHDPKVPFYILILEEVTSENISRCSTTRSQDLVGLTTPALLPNSPEQEGRQSLWCNEKLLYLCCLCIKRRSTALVLQLLFHAFHYLISLYVLIYELLPIAFYNLFIGYSSLSVTSWHPLVNRPDLDTLPMIHTYAMFVAGGFLLKKNMRRIGCSIRICHQRLVL